MAKITFELDVDSKEAQDALKNLTREGQKTSKSLQKEAKKTSAAWSTLKGVLGAQVITAGFSKLASAAKGAFDVIAENTILVETLTTEMTTMTGSATKAAEVMERLQNFAATTPFQLEGIAKAAKQLIAFGFEADTITDKLQSIGDVAAGSGAQLSDVSLIFGQVSAAGRLMGDRLLQFQEKAIPIGPAIAKTMNIAESEVSKFVSKGLVDFATFEKAFKSLSEEGGIFFKSMIDKSKDTSGVISTLKDNIALLASDIGKEFLPQFKQIAIAFTEFIRLNKDDIAKVVIKAIKSIGKAVIQVTRIILTLTAKITEAIDRIEKKGLFKGMIKQTEDLERQLKKSNLEAIIEKFKTQGGSSRSQIPFFAAIIDGFNGIDRVSQESFDKAKKELADLNLAISKEQPESPLAKTLQEMADNLDDLEKSFDRVIKKASKSGKGGSYGLGGLDLGFSKLLDIATEAGIELAKSFGEKFPGVMKTISAAGKVAGAIGSSLLNSLSSGAQATRSGMDKIEGMGKGIEDAFNALQRSKWEASSRTYKTPEEKAALKERIIAEEKEYQKLLDEKVAAEKELGKIQREEAGKFFTSASGAIAEVFLPGAGKFVTQLLELARDPEAFRAFIDGFVANLPEIIDGIVEALPGIIDSIISHLPTIVEALAAHAPDIAWAMIEAVWKLNMRLPDIFMGLVRGLFSKWFGDLEMDWAKVFDPFAEAIEPFTSAMHDLINAINSFSPGGAIGDIGGGGGTTGQIAKVLAAPFTGGASLFADGGIVPSGFPNDSYPARLSSHEEVVSAGDRKSILEDQGMIKGMLGQLIQSSGQPIVVSSELKLNESVFADIILELDRDNRRTSA
jgi:tape measure domain-containing protein